MTLSILLCLFISFVFFTSTYKWNHGVFVFILLLAEPTDKSLVLDKQELLGFFNEKINRNVSDTLIAAGKTANTEHFYLIPENINAEAYRLNFDVTVLQGEKGQEIQIGKYHHSVAFDKMKFEMGKQYRVLAKLNSSNVNPEAEIKPITFTVTVMPWGEDQEGDVSFPGE